MKIVNLSGIPEVLFNALCANWYGGAFEKRDWSVTQLLKPIRSALLLKRHDDEIEVDAASNFWSMMGSAMHIVLEKGSQDKEHLGILVEKRLGMEILGKSITGGMDIYNSQEKSVIDFKFQTVFNWIYLEDHIEDLQFQLNAYRLLLINNGYEVDKLQIIFLFRDWREYEVTRFNGYPDTQYKVLNIDIIDTDEMKSIIEKKILEYEKYKDTPDNELPMCTKEERWQKEDTWKIMFKNKCIKTFYSEEEAEEFVAEKNYGTIKYTHEKPKRCHKYCEGKMFCDFYLSQVLPCLESKE